MGKIISAALFVRVFKILIFSIAIFYTMAIIGPALGYVVGGQLLLLYTDFITIDPLT
jgi:hypothetical protein